MFTSVSLLFQRAWTYNSHKVFWCSVTRLIKASKQQKPTREAFINTGSPSSSRVFGEGSLKLNTAQTELQACETQLANKERELEALRLSTVRVGLQTRCKAMVNCGWSWGEMGKEGLRALETLDGMTNGHCELQLPIRSGSVSILVQVSPPNSPRSPLPSKPLPDIGDASSDLSSILPSHSASQIALVLPQGQPDPKSSDAGHPVPGPSQPYSLEIPPAHSISDYTIPAGTTVPPHPLVGDDSSSDDHRTLEVVENDRVVEMQEPKGRKTKSKRRSEVTTIRMGEKSALPNGSPVTKYKHEDGGRKHGVFGTIAGLFTKGSPKKGWTSRTDKNLKGDSSDEDGVRYLAVSSSKRDAHSTSERIKKRRKNRASTLDHPAFETHDWPMTAGKGKARAASLDYHQGGLSATEDHLRRPRTITRRRSSSQPHLPLPPEATTSLSRNNSLTTSVASVTSAPVGSNSNRTQVTANRRRSTSGVRTPTKASSHRRTSSGTTGAVNPVHAQANLMSIVEEAVRVNQEARFSMNPNHRLESIKAPPSVSEVLKHEADVIQANTQPPPLPPTKPFKSKALPSRGPEDSEVKQITPVQRNKEVGSLATTNTPITKPPLLPVDKTLSPKTPLKSALRNPSRTPSPNPSALPLSLSPPPLFHRVSRISETGEDDSASISSYETVHENFDSRPSSPLAPPVPPRDVVINPGVDSDLSHGTSSTAIGSTDNGTPSRRKSVRMSLPPTYSTTPPARNDWEVGKPPWSSPPRNPTVLEESHRGPRTGSIREGDLWEDSSDEDEEYNAARKLLWKLAERH